MTTHESTRPVAFETTYAGCAFRSRIEARWAVFLDALGVRWAYEPEAYDLPSGGYLPDFWVPALDAFIEIKGAAPNSAEMLKAHELANATGKDVFIFAGSIPYVTADEFFHVGDEDSAYYFSPDGAGDLDYRWCICPDCGSPDIQYVGRAERHCRRSDADCCTDTHTRLIDAYAAARGHRFDQKDGRA